jgi:hypothetical protein
MLQDNRVVVVVALYRMESQKDGAWRIAGCDIAPSNVRSA